MEKEPTFEISQNQRFRQLVESLLKKSNQFSDFITSRNLEARSAEEKNNIENNRTKIIKAIENNELSEFIGENASDKTLDAVSCLTSIYDELGKDKPDEEFIEKTVEQLKEYL